MNTDKLSTNCHSLLVELGVITAAEQIKVTPLTGGVASDIAKVEVPSATWCVKFALPKLKVQADWFAPVHRNAAEYAWLETAARAVPDSAIELYGRSESLHGFAMEYLSDAYLWKSSLLSEAQYSNEAARVGDVLGRIHAASTRKNFATQPFQNSEDFHALRLEPYLLYTATQHPELTEPLNQLADTHFKARSVLLHGDVSPKNIMFRNRGPVLLDAECATMGDASFDLAFCINHLLLKAIHLPNSKHRYLESAVDLWSAYSEHVNWESVTDLESRVCQLLPALMLARVDGKSPVEYLSNESCSTVRDKARHLLQSPVVRLNELLSFI